MCSGHSCWGFSTQWWRCSCFISWTGYARPSESHDVALNSLGLMLAVGSSMLAPLEMCAEHVRQLEGESPLPNHLRAQRAGGTASDGEHYRLHHDEAKT